MVDSICGSAGSRSWGQSHRASGRAALDGEFRRITLGEASDPISMAISRSRMEVVEIRVTGGRVAGEAKLVRVARKNSLACAVEKSNECHRWVKPKKGTNDIHD